MILSRSNLSLLVKKAAPKTIITLRKSNTFERSSSKQVKKLTDINETKHPHKSIADNHSY